MSRYLVTEMKRYRLIDFPCTVAGGVAFVVIWLVFGVWWLWRLLTDKDPSTAA